MNNQAQTSHEVNRDAPNVGCFTLGSDIRAEYTSVPGDENPRGIRHPKRDYSTSGAGASEELLDYPQREELAQRKTPPETDQGRTIASSTPPHLRINPKEYRRRKRAPETPPPAPPQDALRGQSGPPDAGLQGAIEHLRSALHKDAPTSERPSVAPREVVGRRTERLPSPGQTGTSDDTPTTKRKYLNSGYFTHEGDLVSRSEETRPRISQGNSRLSPDRFRNHLKESSETTLETCEFHPKERPEVSSDSPPPEVPATPSTAYSSRLRPPSNEAQHRSVPLPCGNSVSPDDSSDSSPEAIDRAIARTWQRVALGLCTEEEGARIAAVLTNNRDAASIIFKQKQLIEKKRKLRTWAGCGMVPHWLRRYLTQAQQAVAAVILERIKRVGVCELWYGAIAYKAGVCIKTVQRTIAILQFQGFIVRRGRFDGRKNTPTVITTSDKAIREWIGRNATSGLGCPAKKIKEQNFIRPAYSKLQKGGIRAREAPT